MTSDQIRELMRSEFAAHYLYEEMPETWDQPALDELPERAADSAARLFNKVDDRDRKCLIEELLAARANVLHPLVNAIIHGSRFSWNTPEDWPVLQSLLGLIANQLART